MSGLEGSDPTGTDPIDLQLPRAAAGSRNPQTSTTPATSVIETKSLLQVTPYHGGKASFLSWKWSFLIAVRAISKPVNESFKKIEDNMSQDFRKSQLSMKIWSLQIRPTHYQRCFAKIRVCLCEIRGDVTATKRGKHIASTSGPECDKPFEPVTGTNLHVTRPTHQNSTVEQKFRGVCNKNW